MLPVIDFRNGRYQGQTRNQLPHGVGLFIDKNFLLCIGEWVAGELQGNAIVIFPSGRVFSGGIAYRKQQGLCLYELPEDHVHLLVATSSRGDRELMAAVLPLLRIMLQIDNTRSEQARVLAQYAYSEKEEANRAAAARMLGIQRDGSKELASYGSFIQFFRDKFLENYPETLELIVNQLRGRKEYFIGLRGEGLGLKVQPSEQLSSAKKQSGRVYCMRAMGHFTRDNQLRDLGIKTLDNPMKGVVYEEGVFSLPHTIIKYESGKRPLNCSVNFHNHIKRSLFYRDKVLETDYLYDLERYVLGFNKNLRVAETQRLAQFIIENPNNNGQNLAEIERRRRQREKQSMKEVEPFLKPREAPKQMNPYRPYNPTGFSLPNSEFTLNSIKEDICRSASKKKGLLQKFRTDYQRVEYTDPSYTKLGGEDRQRVANVERRVANVERPLIDASTRRKDSISPLNRPKSKSPYQYLQESDGPHLDSSCPHLDTFLVAPLYNRSCFLDTSQQSRKPLQQRKPYLSNKYRSERQRPPNRSLLGDQNILTPLRTHTLMPRYPQSQQPFKSLLHDQHNKSRQSLLHAQHNKSRQRLEDRRPKYNYHFQDQELSSHTATRHISPFGR